MADFMGKKSTLEGYRHIQRREVLNFMQNLYQQPEKFTDHVHLYVYPSLRINVSVLTI